jgi:hypothetical protein
MFYYATICPWAERFSFTYFPDFVLFPVAIVDYVPY